MEIIDMEIQFQCVFLTIVILYKNNNDRGQEMYLVCVNIVNISRRSIYVHITNSHKLLKRCDKCTSWIHLTAQPQQIISF